MSTLFEELLSPEIVIHTVDIYEDIIGIEAFKGHVTLQRTTFSDFNVTLDELIINGDNMVGRWTLTGINTGPFGELPPTGKKVKFSGVEVSHVVDGKVAYHQDFHHRQDQNQQGNDPESARC